MTAPVKYKAKRTNRKPWYSGLTNFFSRAKYLNIGPLKNPAYWSGRLLGYNKAKVAVNEKTAFSVPAYNRAISIISEQIGALSVSVYQRTEEGVFEAPNHPLYPLLKYRPSPLYNSCTFFETVARQAQVRGNCYIRPIYKGAEISEFQILNPPVNIFQIDNGEWYYKFDELDKPLRWDEILHIKRGSMDGITGVNQVKQFEDVLGSAIAQIEYAARYYGNGAHMSGLLIAKRPFTKDQMDQIRESFKANNSGPENVGGTGFIPAEMEYKQVSSTLRDSQFAEISQLTIQHISNMTGVHSTLLGGTDEASYNNVESFNRNFVQYTLRAECKRIEAEFNSKAFSRSERGKFFIKFNLDSLLEGDSKARSELYDVFLKHGAVSINEVREREDWNPRPGADILRVPMNMQPIDKANNNESGEENI